MNGMNYKQYKGRFEICVINSKHNTYFSSSVTVPAARLPPAFAVRFSTVKVSFSKGPSKALSVV